MSRPFLRVRKVQPDAPKVPVPEWGCCEDSQVHCSECRHGFCAGCSYDCPRCGSKTVLRDKRWDHNEVTA